MIRRLVHLGAVCALGLLAACSYPNRNPPAAALAEDSGYRWVNLEKNPITDTLVVVTVSGGGTRATALGAATLEALDRVQLGGGRTLADEVDVISSVSGGSVAAGYFALHGPDGLADLRRKFVEKDGIAALIERGLWSLPVLATPRKERIDLLIDYLDDTLFRDKTFAALQQRGKPPYLILNAADMVTGTVFPFTQYHLDLLCSDLREIKLSTAVAASAAFPVALSPVTLRNHSPCPAQDERRNWPPLWIQNAVDTGFYVNADRLRRGRVAKAYADGPDRSGASLEGKAYVHLLDGGTADNLGITEPVRLITTNDVSPKFLARITNPGAPDPIQRIVFVLVNARSQPPSALDTQLSTPGVLDMLNGTINAAIDNALFGDLDRTRQLIQRGLQQRTKDAPEPVRRKVAELQTSFLTVDFQAIDRTDCRQAFQDIATSWTLPAGEIEALYQVAGPLLAASPAWGEMLDALGAHVPAGEGSLDDACATVLAAQAAS